MSRKLYRYSFSKNALPLTSVRTSFNMTEALKKTETLQRKQKTNKQKPLNARKQAI